MKKAASAGEKQRTVLVRGGGIAGRSLALLLGREGFDVALVERPTPMDEAKDPRAYALNATVAQLLKDLRAWPKDDACPVHDMQIKADEGGNLVFSAWHEEREALAYIVPAVAIERALDQALNYQPRVQRFNASEGSEPPPAALIAVCEGRDSETRTAFGFQMKTQPYEHSSLAARLVCEHAHGNIARQWFTGEGVFALLPLTSPEGNEVSLVWSVPKARATELQALPQSEFETRMREASHDALGKLRLKTPVVDWTLRFAYAERWFATRNGQTAVLVADAAHAMHPLAGQGLNVGLGDVMALARVLHDAPSWRQLSDGKLLRQYERERLAAFLKVGGGCDALFHLYMGNTKPLRSLRNLGMNMVDRLNPLKRWLVAQVQHN